MIVRLHLALVIVIDVRILVLDEPTLGLDILYRKIFFQSMLNDYYNEERTIIIATHKVKEIESILRNLMIINHQIYSSKFDRRNRGPFNSSKSNARSERISMPITSYFGVKRYRSISLYF